MTGDGLPLKERVERYLDRRPDASVPEVAGALNESAAAVAEVLGEDTTGNVVSAEEREDTAIRDHYRRAGPALDELARLEDGTPTAGFVGNAGWYHVRPETSPERIREGYTHRARANTLARDYDEIVADATADAAARSMYALLTYADDYLGARPVRREDDGLVDRHGDTPLPDYADLDAMAIAVDIDLEDEHKTRPLAPAQRESFERVVAGYVDAFADVVGTRDHVFALDSVGGAYVFIPPAVTGPIGDAFEADAQGRIFEELATRAREFTAEIEEELAADFDGEDADLWSADHITHKNRQFKSPLSIHKRIDGVVHPIDTDDISYEFRPLGDVDDETVATCQEWARGFTSSEHATAVEALVAALWPEASAEADDWREALRTWVEEQRAGERRQSARLAEVKTGAPAGTDEAVEGDTSSTGNLDEIYQAVDQLDPFAVAEKTIVHRWTEDVTDATDRSGPGKRAFIPTWGTDYNSGNANYVDEKGVWVDTANGVHGTVVEMALIAAEGWRRGKIATGADWFRGLDELRKLGFDIPEYDPPASTVDHDHGHGATAEHGIEECEPPRRDAEPFDAEERWAELQGDRFDDVLAHDGIDLWGDEAGAGKTTNAALGALDRDYAHAIYFDKHEKAREFILDEAIREFEAGPFQDAEYFHLKGGEQKRHGHCMDADHSDDDVECPEHGHPSQCPSMCPIYDRDPDDDLRQAYEALVAEVGPNKAHQILDLHDEDEHPWHGGECAWQAQYSQVESEPFVVAVHPYMTQKSVRETGLNIIDETPDLHAHERTVGPTELTQFANTLDRIADLRPRDDPVTYTARELARFARDVVDVITDADRDVEELADLEPPTVTWTAYEAYDDAAGHHIAREQPEEDWHLAEALAQAKLAHGETILKRMQRQEWEGTPISLDPLLAAAVAAGIDEEPVMQAVALPPVLEHCPWCASDLAFDNGVRCCESDDCDWHEREVALVRQDAEVARAAAWFVTDPSDAVVALRYRELPLPSDLPTPASTLVLDATATPDKVATLFGVDHNDVAVAGDEPLELPNLHVLQLVDGQYHASTIKAAIDEDRQLAERIQRAIDTAADVHERPLFIVKKGLMDAFEFPEEGEVLHYHATRGLNRAECDAVMCIGAPHPDVEDLQRDAELLAMGRDDVRVGGAEYSTRRDAPNPPVYRMLHYADDRERGRAVPTKAYSGLVGELFQEARENELEQAVHRIRPLLAEETKNAYLLTNVPTDVPVDELASFEELVDPIKALLPVPDGAVELLEHVHDVVAGDGPDGFRAEQLVEHRDDGAIANKPKAFHRLARLCGMAISERTTYEYVNALEEVGLLEPETYEQRAGVSYAADFATLQSALQVLSNNVGFKVAAVRRLRAILAGDDPPEDWLRWLREALDLGGDHCALDPPPTSGG